MNRRTFIKIGIITNILVWTGLYVLDFRWAVKRILLKDIEPLNIDRSAVDKFLLEADNEMFWRQFSLPKKIFISIHHALEVIGLKLPYHEKYIQYRNVITGQFLLSTDLFFAGARTGRKIRYMGFLNPYKTGCSNPFSSMRMPI